MKVPQLSSVAQEEFMSRHSTADETYQVTEYLASPAGLAVFQEIEDKPDDYRVTLRIPEPGGIFTVTMSAGSIRRTVGEIISSVDDARLSPTVHVRQRRGSLIEQLLEGRKIGLEAVQASKLIDISAAAAQFHATYPVGTTYYNAHKACPNVAPPFGAMIFESGCPLGLEEYGYGRAAVFATSEEASDPPPGLNIVAKWELMFTVVFESNGTVQKYPFRIYQYVDANGRLATDASGEQWYLSYEKMLDDEWPRQFLRIPSIPNSESDRLAAHAMDWFVAPALFAISLMHCKNVSVKPKARIVPHSRKVLKRRKGLPILEHHIIEIRDRQNQVSNGDALESAIRKKLHIVRGHYSTYTKEAPLFGRVVGTFWVPAHARGSFDEGVSTSEYRVLPHNRILNE